MCSLVIQVNKFLEFCATGVKYYYYYNFCVKKFTEL
jgi:hypothetical protein